MAKQKGIIKIEGTLGDITFVKTQDGYIAKEKTSLNGNRIATDTAFQRTRENNAEFGRAGKAGKLLRNAIRTLLLQAKDKRVTSRLTTEMLKVIKADATSNRGNRNVIDGEAELLQGFDFNSNAKLSAALYAPYTATIDRTAGILTVSIPSFIPAERIAAPAGTTHYKLVSLGAELDFEKETFIADSKESGIMPWDIAPTDDLVFDNAVTPNSNHPLFLLLGIQFYQLVNGSQYPLKDGGFNALNLVKVSGV